MKVIVNNLETEIIQKTEKIETELEVEQTKTELELEQIKTEQELKQELPKLPKTGM